MKIFVNAFLEKNLGDDLFMEILLKRYPNNQFITASSKIKKRKNLKVYSNFIFIKIMKRLGLSSFFYRKADIIVTIGGSMYMEDKRKTKFYKGTKPYYILGTNFGPFYTQKYFLNAKKYFEKAQDVCFREKYSYILFNDLKNVRVASDIVFSLDVKDIKTTNEKIAIFSIIDCDRKINSKYTEIYEKKIIEMSKYLIEKGYKICYMSFCKKEGDEKAIERILTNIDIRYASKINKYFYNGNLKEALEVLGKSQVIFAGRFHANIIGMLLQKTVIPMIYSDKTKHLLKDMNFEGISIDIKEIEKFNVKNLTEEKMNYKKNIDFQKEDAERHFEKLDIILNRRNDGKR